MSGSPGVSVHLTVLGLPITLRAHGADAELLRSAVVTAWSRCLRTGPDVGVILDVALAPMESLAEISAAVPGVVVFHELDAAMDSLSPMVTRLGIEGHAGTLLMLHACAVADPVTGKTVALVGPSGAGKTTAAGSLCKQFAYVTDETVGITNDFAVLPYPKPLSLVRAGNRFKRQVSPDEMGYVATGAPLGLLAVLLLDRIPGLGEAVLDKVPLLEGLSLAASETSYLSRLDAPLHRLGETLDRGPGLQRVRYGEAAQLIDLVADLFHP